MSHEALLRIEVRDWLRSTLSRGRFVYLIALALPSVSLMYWLLEPYPLYQLEAWAWLALAPICVVQFFRQTVVGWAMVVGAYSWSAFLQIPGHIGAFEDIGSEDHSRWEGWSSELVILGITAWLVFVIALMVIYRPKRMANAT